MQPGTPPVARASMAAGPHPEPVSAQTPSQTPTQTPTPTTRIPSAANASSKKRAKARKKAGLEALLAASRETNVQSGRARGLDLMDLMKGKPL